MAIIEVVLGVIKYDGDFWKIPKIESFLYELRLLLPVSEIDKNLEAIYKMDSKYHFTFIELIKAGYSFNKANHLVPVVFEMECHHPLTTYEIVKVMRENQVESKNEISWLLNVKRQTAQ